MNKIRTATRAKSIPVGLRPMFGRQLVVLGIVALVLWMLREKLPALDISEVFGTLERIRPAQWGLAALATIASFWAVGRYDQVLHGLLGTAVDPKRARFSGTVSIAIAQFAGFGVLTGALVRWRMLPELTLPAALRVSFAVSVSFLAGWAVVAALAVVVGGTGPFGLRLAAICVLALAAGLSILLLIAPGKNRNWPSLGAWGAIAALALVDTMMAAGAFHILLPQGMVMPLTLFIPAFLLALGAGLIGGTPGGVGPFEVSLLAFLPHVPADALLGTALAFRMVYFLVPAALALAALFRGAGRQDSERVVTLLGPQRSAFLSPELEALVWSAPRAEVSLLRQGEIGVLRCGAQALALAAPVGQSLVMVLDPLERTVGAVTRTLVSFQKAARLRIRAPLIYKCSARTAVIARSAGWKTLAIAQDAWLDPTKFSQEGSHRRQLRRMCRKGEKSGVTVVEGGRCLPLDDMQAVAEQWSRSHGGERGFSMGRFGRDYVNCQRVFLAYRGDELVGFVTFHETRSEWTLDLMRHTDQAPDGTMHLLVTQAISSAAAMKCTRLSLAAVPYDAPDTSWLVTRMRQSVSKFSGGAGLRRFKTSFSPHWQPLYAAAPGWWALVLGLAAVARRTGTGRR